MTIQYLADQLTLGALLDELRRSIKHYELLDHWQQGEFHHDILLYVDCKHSKLPGSILVVATNCNGGIKEVLCFRERPDRNALWHYRCPENPEFTGELPEILASAKTLHWFDPCELLKPDARSEYRLEFRERQQGGGWKMKSCCVAISESCLDRPADATST